MSGSLQLVPSGAVRAVPADGYTRMLADGMLPDGEEPFEALVERYVVIEARANGSRA